MKKIKLNSSIDYPLVKTDKLEISKMFSIADKEGKLEVIPSSLSTDIFIKTIKPSRLFISPKPPTKSQHLEPQKIKHKYYMEYDGKITTYEDEIDVTDYISDWRHMLYGRETERLMKMLMSNNLPTIEEWSSIDNLLSNLVVG